MCALTTLNGQRCCSMYVARQALGVKPIWNGRRCVCNARGASYNNHAAHISSDDSDEVQLQAIPIEMNAAELPAAELTADESQPAMFRVMLQWWRSVTAGQLIKLKSSWLSA